MHAGRLPGTSLIVSLVIVLAGCGASGTPSAGQAPTATIGPRGSTGTGGGFSPGTGAGQGSSAAPPGVGTVEGSITSSGLLDATWTWEPDDSVEAGAFTLTSDKGTFSNLEVGIKGDITFTSGDPKLSAGSPFRGPAVKSS